MLNVSDIKEGMKLEYVGDSSMFDGQYHVFRAESTYVNAEDCPYYEKGKMLIIEFSNDDTPMFFFVGEDLDLNEWKIANKGGK